MTQALQQTLRDSAVARWGALALVSLTMFFAYFFYDVMAPLKSMLEQQMQWSNSEYGFFTSAYGWFNVFLFMLIFGGLILDKMGVRFTGMASCGLMVLGCAMKYYAIAMISPDAGEILGYRTQVIVASLGFAIFGMGSETMGITATKVIVVWFKGKEMALAMGLQVAIARLGTMLAFWIVTPIANQWGLPMPLLFSLVGLCAGLCAYIVYCVMDTTLIRQLGGKDDAQEDEQFKLSDVKAIITNSGFWLIAVLCVLFYSSVFPFLKYATDLMENKYGVSADNAGFIVGLLPLGTLFLTPLFGAFYDRAGKGATIMIVGAIMLITVHLSFALPILNYWWFASTIMIILGVAFSLVPSAMWPAVAKIIPERQLGTAYALIFWIQNIGMMLVPLLVGYVLDEYCHIEGGGEGASAYNYTLPMVMFTAFGVLALIVAVTLKRVDRKKGYGLEEANIAE